jgi:hypothetical protein
MLWLGAPEYYPQIRGKSGDRGAKNDATSSAQLKTDAKKFKQ